MSAATFAEAAVFAAWDTYRRSQDIPAPACGHWGELTRAQRELHDLTEPYASGREAMSGADLDAIERAREDLAEVVRRCCGTEAAAHIGGEEGRAAA